MKIFEYLYIFIRVLPRFAQTQREEGQREARKIIGEKIEPVYQSEAQLVQHHLDCIFNKHISVQRSTFASELIFPDRLRS